MDDVRDVTLGTFTNIFSAMLLPLLWWLVASIRAAVRRRQTPEAAESWRAHAVDVAAHWVRRSCGLAAFMTFTGWLAANWLIGARLWEHLLGWLLILGATAVICVAFYLDGVRRDPGESDRSYRVSVWFDHGLYSLSVIAFLVFSVRLMYFDDRVSALRHQYEAARSGHSGPATRPMPLPETSRDQPVR